MRPSPIYTSEPMVTRALAAEIRHFPDTLQVLLENRSGRQPFGLLQRVRCEGTARVDVLLEFEQPDGEWTSVGLEAKFDHELTRAQIRREAEAVQQLFIVVHDAGGVPQWLDEAFPTVPVLSWHEVLSCFPDSRITPDDVRSIRTSKADVEAHFNRLRPHVRTLLGEDWAVDCRRNDSGNPSLIIQSPRFPDGRSLRGQIQVTGRGMPPHADDVRLESHMGISVVEDETNYFDPTLSAAVPEWIKSLRTLQRDVLDGNERRLLINRRAPGTSSRELGQWKKPLALKHLKQDAHLAKGYVNWAIGPKTVPVALGQLDMLAAITVEVFERWFMSEDSSDLGRDHPAPEGPSRT